MNPYLRLPVPTEILALADPDSTIRKRLPSGRILEIPVVHESDPSITVQRAIRITLDHFMDLYGVKP